MFPPRHRNMARITMSYLMMTITQELMDDTLETHRKISQATLAAITNQEHKDAFQEIVWDEQKRLRAWWRPKVGLRMNKIKFAGYQQIMLGEMALGHYRQYKTMLDTLELDEEQITEELTKLI